MDGHDGHDGHADPGAKAAASAAKAAGWLNRTGWRVARRFPGGEAAEREVRKLEGVVLDEVRRALNGHAPAQPAGPARTPRAPGPGAAHASAGTPQAHAPAPSGGPGMLLRRRMAELLELSVELDRAGSEHLLYEALLGLLVPDEARILAALSDGTAYPVIDVVTKRQHTVLRNASTVGRASGVVALDNVPAYLARLYAFGLVELGEPVPELGVQYDILATDQAVAAARDSIPKGARLVQRSVRLSALGVRLWNACDPTGPADGQ